MKKEKVNEFTPMQDLLLKVLSEMEMNMNDKVLIAMYLQKDNQIMKFIEYLDEQVPFEEVKNRVEEIKRKARLISGGILKSNP